MTRGRETEGERELERDGESALNGIPSDRLYGCRRYEHSIERYISTRNLKSLQE
jgi:hypothetical protein